MWERAVRGSHFVHTNHLQCVRYCVIRFSIRLPVQTFNYYILHYWIILFLFSCRCRYFEVSLFFRCCFSFNSLLYRYSMVVLYFNNNAPTCVSCTHIRAHISTHTVRQDRYFVCSVFFYLKIACKQYNEKNGWALRSEINYKFENISMMCNVHISMARRWGHFENKK